jgi:hypothetical protein
MPIASKRKRSIVGASKVAKIKRDETKVRFLLELVRKPIENGGTRPLVTTRIHGHSLRPLVTEPD